MFPHRTLALSFVLIPALLAQPPADPKDKDFADRGGNARSEEAVAKGLRWLALHQAADGRWSLHQFNRFARTAPVPLGKVVPDTSKPGTSRNNDVAGTAFAL